MMDLKQIQELIKSINKSNVGTFRLKQGDFEIAIKQKNCEAPQVVYQSAPVQAAAPVAAPAPAPAAAPASKPEPAAAAPEKEKPSNTITVNSPMIGTFYRSPSPDKPAFVSVGDNIKVGDTVCIVEAMKLFNEIESEVSGKVVKILVDDATPVEYDQPLFLVEPA